MVDPRKAEVKSVTGLAGVIAHDAKNLFAVRNNNNIWIKNIQIATPKMRRRRKSKGMKISFDICYDRYFVSTQFKWFCLFCSLQGRC